MSAQDNFIARNVVSSAHGTRSLVMLDETGDTTIEWSEDEDAAMLAIIEKKMAAGVTFYTIPQRKPGQRGRVAGPKPLKNPDDALKHRALAIKDEDFSKFVLEGKGRAVLSSELSPIDKSEPVKRAKTAKEVASGHSVGVRQRVGG